MITQSQLDKLSEIVSSLPCPDCGGTHAVTLKLVHSSAMSSIDSPAVVIGFPDTDVCEGFRQKANAFIEYRISSMNLPPFPFDRI